MITLTPGAITILRLCARPETATPETWSELDATPADFESLKTQGLIHTSDQVVWWPTAAGYRAFVAVTGG